MIFTSLIFGEIEMKELWKIGNGVIIMQICNHFDYLLDARVAIFHPLSADLKCKCKCESD